MKNIFIGLFCVFASFLVAQKTNIKVNVENVKNADGKIMIALYNSEETYMKTLFKGDEPKAKEGTVVGEFKDVPFGTYAVAVFHDENENKKLDTNFMGIPKEAYGFSNNASGFMGPPSFKDAAFKVNGSAEKVINIRIK